MEVSKVIDARYDLEHEMSKLVCEFNKLTDCHIISVLVDNYERVTLCGDAGNEESEKYSVKMAIDTGI
jgi:hypothetical protein